MPGVYGAAIKAASANRSNVKGAAEESSTTSLITACYHRILNSSASWSLILMMEEHEECRDRSKDLPEYPKLLPRHSITK